MALAEPTCFHLAQSATSPRGAADVAKSISAPLWIFVHVNVWIHKHTRTNSGSIHVFMYTYMSVPRPVYIHTYIHTYIHPCKPACIDDTYVHTYVHKQTMHMCISYTLRGFGSSCREKPKKAQTLPCFGFPGTSHSPSSSCLYTVSPK